MPLSRLENFLVNTDGNILYVNPSDLDATDSFDNKGNSLTRPFVTIQRALIEAARFSYQSGQNNDKFDRTTILLYPGEHVIDNRPGLYVKNNGGSVQYFDVNKSDVTGTTDIELDNGDTISANITTATLASGTAISTQTIATDLKNALDTCLDSLSVLKIPKLLFIIIGR